ncbi:hypothetical protein SEVIR_5G291401v4 [Setaria viridis]|uniref:Uncharacterized protein n=1 Tax=Setaria italica TaxID=4555 RepID=K3XTF8_SETIT|nr:hypothetical protein SETIT_5G288200v2 [Setaria italica]
MPDLQRRRPDPAAPHARLLIIGRISSSSLTRSISPSPPFDQIAALNDAWMLPRFNILSIKTHGSSVDSFSYYLFSFLFHRAIVLATVYSIFAV